MLKGMTKFPFKFNKSLHIKTGNYQNSKKLLEILTAVIPHYAHKTCNYRFGYTTNHLEQSVNSEVIRIKFQLKRIHTYLQICGFSRSDYNAIYAHGTIDIDAPLCMDALTFIRICENKIKEKCKHA